MPRMIWVFAGCTGHFVGFVMQWLNFEEVCCPQVVTYLYPYYHEVWWSLPVPCCPRWWPPVAQSGYYSSGWSCWHHETITLSHTVPVVKTNKWAAPWQNQQNDLCTQRRLRSAWASAQSDQSLRCPHEETLSYPLSALQRLWSAWVDAQADLSLRWAHRSFCWFCHEAAQIVNLTLP